MTGPLRPPEHHVHGLWEPVVIVPARVAQWLDRVVGLDALRQRAIGDPHVGTVLAALALATADAGSRGTDNRKSAEPRPLLVSMTTTQAATVLGLSDRAVRKAIAENRLLATKNAAGSWRITR